MHSQTTDNRRMKNHPLGDTCRLPETQRRSVSRKEPLLLMNRYRISSAVTGTIAAVSLLSLASVALAHPRMTPELFKKFWPSAETSVVRRVSLTAAEKAEITKSLGVGAFPKELNDVDVFIVSSKASTLGVLANTDVSGTDIGVAVDRSRKKIIKAHLYATNAATRKLTDPAFLKQFTGKTAADAFRVGKDIKPVAGDPKGSQAIANSVKGSLLFLQKGL